MLGTYVSVCSIKVLRLGQLSKIAFQANTIVRVAWEVVIV